MDLFARITDRTTLLTPNRRLSAYYSEQYIQYQKKLGKATWKTLDILPWNSWLERLWACHTQTAIFEKNILLNSNQELIVWESIIRQSSIGQLLLQITATAEIAKSAWGLLKQWNIKLDHTELTTTDDGKAFVAWAQEFQNRCQKNHWLDLNTLLEYIIEKIQATEIKLENDLLLIGFAEHSPLQNKLLQTCENKNTKIDTYNTPNQNISAQKIGLHDRDTELYSMAKWAKAIYTTHDKNKPLRIACVVNNLEDIRPTINRIFTDVFSETKHFTLNALELPFNISAGRSLAAYPIIHTALKLLTLQRNTITIENLSYLLRSPFVGSAELEIILRANFDAQLHKDNDNTIQITQLIKNINAPPQFILLLNNYITQLEQYTESYSLGEWASIFITLLKSLGWPGERNINSEEYQVAYRWLAMLQDTTQLDFVTEKLDYNQALHYLTRITADTVFQPQSPETPIQILGILEAAEIPYHYLWIMGMDDMQWPPAPKPNPFIPQTLQNNLLMPHSTAERELQFCTSILQQLVNCAEHIIFSYPKHDSDTELQSSALLDQYNEINLDQLPQTAYVPIEDIIFQHQLMEQIEDLSGPAIQPDEKIHGGVKILELQALCPFKAFAELRLHAKPIDETQLGLRALDKGNIVHKALEIIWQELRDSTTLHTKNDTELTALIQHAIEKSFPTAVKNRIGKRFYALEKIRLEKIIQQWMLIEKSRPSFRVIAQEQQTKLSIGNLTIAMRIDRVDHIENHGNFIIDYKTGKYNNVTSWFGNRPEAPQLPMYCIIDPTNTIGIAFGIINTEKNELVGVSKDNINTTKISTLDKINADEPSWEKQIAQWNDTFLKLADDFHHGIAIVDPKNKTTTCNHCQLTSFCRINAESTSELAHE